MSKDLVHGELSHVSAPLALQALNTRWALAAPDDFSSDIDVLNYALTLEYLEAAFYKQGNSAGLLSGMERTYLEKIGSDEAYHVAALTDTIKKLGGTPVAAPGVDFGSPFDSRKNYLTTSHTFENVGVGAYLGAAGYISDKTILQAAAGIFGVEARHAARRQPPRPRGRGWGRHGGVREARGQGDRARGRSRSSPRCRRCPRVRPRRGADRWPHGARPGS